VTETPAPHPSFAKWQGSWELSLEADGYSGNTVTAYGSALRQFASWLCQEDPGISATEVTTDHLRGFIVHVRRTRSSGTARSWFAGLRHFYRFVVGEDEMDRDPTATIKTPKPNDPQTPVLSTQDLKKLLKVCQGKGFVHRRDEAILRLFIDGGLRRSELAGLQVTDIDIRDRMIFVEGKGSRRSGPRRRAVPIGVITARCLDRYLRERDRHPHADNQALWLGDRSRGPISADGVEAVVNRRAAEAGIEGLHLHVFRHTWASQFRGAGGSEGDLMVLGGWRSRAMLDRYGRVEATQRAKESYRRLSLGDRL